MKVTIYDLIKKSRTFGYMMAITFAALLLYLYYADPYPSITAFMFHTNRKGDAVMLYFFNAMMWPFLWSVSLAPSIMKSVKKRDDTRRAG